MNLSVEELLLAAAGFAAWLLIYRLSPLYRSKAEMERRAELLAFAVPALLEPKEFFELIELSDEHSHYLERHGPILKIEEILERANTGRLESFPHQGRPVHSSRWFFHEHLHLAVISALELWESGKRPEGGQFNFHFPHNIGEGYLKGTQEKKLTNLAAVIIRDGSVISAYPVLKPKTGMYRDLSRADETQSDE